MSGIHKHDEERLEKLMAKGALEQWAATTIRKLAEQRIKDTAEIRLYRDALDEIASQGRQCEFEGEDADRADFEQGYDMCVLTARAAVSDRHKTLGSVGAAGSPPVHADAVNERRCESGQDLPSTAANKQCPHTPEALERGGMDCTICGEHIGEYASDFSPWVGVHTPAETKFVDFSDTTANSLAPCEHPRESIEGEIAPAWHCPDCGNIRPVVLPEGLKDPKHVLERGRELLNEWEGDSDANSQAIEAETILIELTEKLLWYADEKGAIMAPQIRSLVKAASVVDVRECNNCKAIPGGVVYVTNDGFCRDCGKPVTPVATKLTP